LIWGSTWLAIKYQLGVVDPLVSVVYRFFLASGILLLYCRITSLNLKFTIKEHMYMALLGIFLFGTNYWLVYLAELHLPSGLVALVFSSIIFLNIVNGAIFLKSKIRLYVVYGALIGMIGIVFVFNEEILFFSLYCCNSCFLWKHYVGIYPKEKVAGDSNKCFCDVLWPIYNASGMFGDGQTFQF